MTEHVFDDLPQLLSGEANRSTVNAVAEHLRSCDDCRDELISALVAHAALTSAVRYAPDLTVTAEPAVTPEPAKQPAKGSVKPLPDLSAVFAQVRAEADAADSRVDPPVDPRGGQRHRASRIARYRLLAAAAVVVLGLGGGAIAIVEHNTSSPSRRSVALDAYGVGTSAATAHLVGGNQMTLNASSLPDLGAGSYYEVWLTNAARTAMAPVGQLNAQGMGTFTVPTAEMSSFGAIEVSVQKTAGVGNYSGVSVLRGSYA